MSGTYTWNGGDGDWYSDNWDAPGSNTPGAAPPSGASVTIGNASTVTLGAGDPNPGGSVFIDDGTLTVYATGIALATLTLAGIDTGAEINGSGTVDVTNFYMGAQYLNGVVSSGYIGGSLTVVLTGLGNIGGTLGIDQIGDGSGGTAELNIASGALLTIEDSAGLGADANGILVNDGTLEKLAASGTVQGTSLITSQFTNVGTIQVDAGVLQLGGSTITLGGAVDGAGVLDLVGTATLESNLVLLAGGVTLETSGTTTLDQVAAAIPAGDVFEQTGGTLTANTLLPSGTADLVVDGEAVLSAGELADTSATYPASPDLLIASTGTLAITGYTSYGTYSGGYVFGSGYLENEGQATIGADQDGNTYSALQYAYSTPAVYANEGTTTLLDSNVTSVLGAVGPGYNGGFFYNYGTLININDQTADINATQTNTIQVYSFDNYGGTVDVQSGDLEINIAGGAFQGGSFSGAGTLGLGGGLDNANISIEFGATSTVATLEFDPYGNGLYDIGQDFTQSGVLDIGNGGGAATLHLDTDYLSPPTPAETTLTVNGATNMTDGVLEVGTLVAEGGIDMPIYEDFFQVSGSTLENGGSGTLLGELELSQGTLSLNSGVGGTLVNDQGAVISLSGTLEGDYDRYASITADDTSEEIANNGTLVGDGPSGYGSGPLYAGNFPGPYISASIANDGLIEVQQGALLLDGVDGDAITGTGSIQIDANAAVEIDTPVSGNSIVFSGTGALLQIDDLSNTDSGPLVQDFNAPISGFAAGDTIDLFNIAYAGASIDVAPDNSSVSIYSDNTYEGTLDFDPPAGTFQLTDLGGVAALTLSPAPCYCPGTLILTDRGEVPIEDLRIGDTVMTASGQSQPIRWIGRRSYAGAFITGRRDILPVRIARGALAEGVPHRDLWVSPMHAMYLEGYLIPAVALVNGISIVQAEAVEHVAYVNLELPSHDVILAEGAPAETFIDDESRYQFQNAAEYETLYPQATRSPPVYYAARLEEGDRLHAICAAIAARAAGAAHPPSGPLEGRLDLVSSELIEGWARDLGNPDAPVRLRILDNKQVLCEVLANRFRPDLKEAGIGDGCHAFSVTVPGGLAPQRRHLIEVQRAADGQLLPNAPLLLEARPPCPVVACEKPATWRGQLESVSRERIEGWAWDSAQPASPVRLQVLIDGDVVAGVVANRFRQDLAQAGIGDGRHAFSLVIPGGLSPLSRHVIRVLCEADGTDMHNSPFVLEPATAFDAALERAVESAVTALATPGGVTEAQGRVLEFLAAQTERLLQLRAESEAGPHLRLVQRQLRRQAVRELPESANSRRALVVTTDFSRPGCDAHISKLQQMGYDICLVAAANLTPDAETVARLEQADITVCRTPFYASVEEVFRRQAACLDLITLDGPAIAACYAALARSHAPRVRIMCYTDDLATAQKLRA